VSQPIGLLTGFTPDSSLAVLRQGAKGDVVVWAQEHLVSAGERIAVDGGFGGATKAAVRRFQLAKGLSPASGTIGALTWHALLRYRPASVTWSRRGARVASAAGANVLPVPASASLPARGDEIPRGLGAGRP
jgi:peptidoglycan hydrolase-like protein with peptidoglycan-binding domain